MSKVEQITQEAIDRVRDNNLSQYERILDFAEVWVTTQFKEFSNEDLKNCYYMCGNPEPVQPCVYGAVIRELSRRKAIFEHGTTKAKNPISHSRLMRTWISREYKLKQKQNAKKDITLDMFENKAS